MADVAFILNQWAAWGVFDYILPFLFIFAVVFGILEYAKIFGDNKSVKIIIAVVIGLMALQFGFVTAFFPEFFSRFGVALAIILAILILLAMFIPEEKRMNWMNGLGFFAVAAFIVLLYNSFNASGFLDIGYLTDETLAGLIGIALVIGVIVAVVSADKESKTNPGKYSGLYNTK